MPFTMEGPTRGQSRRLSVRSQSNRSQSVRSQSVVQAVTDTITSSMFLRIAAVGGVLLTAAPALAANSGGDPMPWEGPMDQFLSFFTGPFVRIAAIIAIVLIGVGMAFSENGTGMRKLTTAFFGLSLAFGAATWGLSFFGFSGGASIATPAAVVEQEQQRFSAETPAVAPDLATVSVDEVVP